MMAALIACPPERHGLSRSLEIIPTANTSPFLTVFPPMFLVGPMYRGLLREGVKVLRRSAQLLRALATYVKKGWNA
jgi:hypothetical protein